MSSPVFAISPARSSGPASVRLSMPATGYEAAASVTDPCGHAIPGASVSVTGDVATPHIPAAYHGTAYLDWTVQAVSQPSAGAQVHLVLASRQDIGHATTCTTGASPYGHATGHVAPGASSPAGEVAGGLLVVLLVLAGVAAWWLLRRRPRRHRPAHGGR